MIRARIFRRARGRQSRFRGRSRPRQMARWQVQIDNLSSSPRQTTNASHRRHLSRRAHDAMHSLRFRRRTHAGTSEFRASFYPSRPSESTPAQSPSTTSRRGETRISPCLNLIRSDSGIIHILASAFAYIKSDAIASHNPTRKDIHSSFRTFLVSSYRLSLATSLDGSIDAPYFFIQVCPDSGIKKQAREGYYYSIPYPDMASCSYRTTYAGSATEILWRWRSTHVH